VFPILYSIVPQSSSLILTTPLQPLLPASPQSTSEGAATVANDNEDQELQRAALQSAAEKYVLSNYPSEYSAAGAYAKDDGFSIVLSGEKINLRNFWSGRWTSSWTLQAKDGAATLSGDIKVVSTPTRTLVLSSLVLALSSFLLRFV
jgi:hypothetical protein